MLSFSEREHPYIYNATQCKTALVEFQQRLNQLRAFVLQETSTGLFYNNETYVIMVSCLDSNHVSNAGRIAFSWYQLIVVFLFPVVTIIYCYTFVIAVLWMSTKRLAQLTHTERFGLLDEMIQCG